MTLKLSTKKEKKYMVTYAHSRKEEDIESLLCTISIPQFDWVEEEMIEWNQDQKVCNIIQQIQ
jgi:hypothetical protein